MQRAYDTSLSINEAPLRSFGKEIGASVAWANAKAKITGAVLTFQHSLINFAHGIEKLGPDSIYSE